MKDSYIYAAGLSATSADPLLQASSRLYCFPFASLFKFVIPEKPFLSQRLHLANVFRDGEVLHPFDPDLVLVCKTPKDSRFGSSPKPFS